MDTDGTDNDDLVEKPDARDGDYIDNGHASDNFTDNREGSNEDNHQSDEVNDLELSVGRPSSNIQQRNAIKDILNYQNMAGGKDSDGESELDDETDNDRDDDLYAKYGLVPSKSSERFTQMAYKKLTLAKFIKGHAIPIFLEKLNYDAILQPLVDFDSAFKAGQNTNSNPTAGNVCGDMITALECSADAAETAIAIPKFWQSAQHLEQYVALQAIENRISRALLMLSSSKACSWVVQIATDAIRHPGKLTWYHKLGRDISQEWTKAYANSTPYKFIFDSNMYLPGLTPLRQATITMKRWTFNSDRQNRDMIDAISCVVQQWLQFPQGPNHKVQCALVSILTKHVPLSILLLEDVWMMFLKPYHSVIHGKVGQRISEHHTEKVLGQFEDALCKHALTDQKSSEHLLLAVLGEKTEEWFRLVASTKKTQPLRKAASKETVSVHFNIH